MKAIAVHIPCKSAIFHPETTCRETSGSKWFEQLQGSFWVLSTTTKGKVPHTSGRVCTFGPQNHEKYRIIGRLKTRLFTIKTSKHVGFGGPWYVV